MPDVTISGFANNLHAMTVTILSGAAVSEIIATQGDALVGIEMPAAWTAADIGYKSSITGNVSKLQRVYDAGGNPEKTVVVASANVAVPQADTIFTAFLQLQSVSTADDVTPVNQGADRVITLIFRKYLS